MKKLVATLSSFALLALLVAGSPSSNAATVSQIDKQIKEANQEIKAAEQKAAQAEQEKQQIESEQVAITGKVEDLKVEIEKLNKEIEANAKEKAKTEVAKSEKEDELYETEQELHAAEAEVVKSDELLQKRTRLMYSNGVVSYLDVLLSATSFTDFLDRFDSLQLILQSDREILEHNKEVQLLVTEKKAELDMQLEELTTLVEQLKQEQAVLATQEAEKETLVASYAAKSAELHEHAEDLELISEEQEKLLVQLASKVSKLNAEKKRISNPYSGGKLGMPIDSKYRVTSNFGVRIHPITGVRKQHNGMDFGAPSGTPIYAAESGIVIVSKTWSGYGNTVIIDHGNGLWTLYGHIKNGGLLVNEGDSVKKGDKIALVGSTGNSTGPHLHFEVRKNEVPVNPASYLK